MPTTDGYAFISILHIAQTSRSEAYCPMDHMNPVPSITSHHNVILSHCLANIKKMPDYWERPLWVEHTAANPQASGGGDTEKKSRSHGVMARCCWHFCNTLFFGGDLHFTAADVLLVGWLVGFPAVAHQDAELMQSGLTDTHWPLGTSVPTVSERRDITGGDWACCVYVADVVIWKHDAERCLNATCSAAMLAMPLIMPAGKSTGSAMLAVWHWLAHWPNKPKWILERLKSTLIQDIM